MSFSIYICAPSVIEKINVSVQYPVFVHDARILHKSPIFYHALYPPATYFLLRNGAYPCMEEPIGISYLHLPWYFFSCWTSNWNNENMLANQGPWGPSKLSTRHSLLAVHSYTIFALTWTMFWKRPRTFCLVKMSQNGLPIGCRWTVKSCTPH